MRENILKCRLYPENVFQKIQHSVVISIFITMQILHFSVCSMQLSIVSVKSAFRDCCVLCSALSGARGNRL